VCRICGRKESESLVNNKTIKEYSGCNRQSKYCKCKPLKHKEPTGGGGGGGVIGGSSYSGYSDYSYSDHVYYSKEDSDILRWD